jgi:hypothetical protein
MNSKKLKEITTKLCSKSGCVLRVFAVFHKANKFAFLTLGASGAICSLSAGAQKIV